MARFVTRFVVRRVARFVARGVVRFVARGGPVLTQGYPRLGSVPALS